MPKGPLGQWPQTDQDGGYPHNLPIGGIVYNATPPAPADGQAVALQGDADGNLKVNIAATDGLTNPLPVTGTVTTTPPAVADYADPAPAQGADTTLSVDLAGFLRTRTRSESILGDGVTGSRYNQLEINFSTAFDSNLITNTITSGGTATQGSGCATYASGTNAAGKINGTSIQVLEYRPGHEWYAYFTASFTAGAANSHQRIGPYNATDGFWIGYEGTTFGFTHYVNSSPTQIARTSFNGDPANGLAGSSFTSGGSLVALDLSKINIFRIHGAWFGVSPIALEVFSPDGAWVVLHTFLFPNTLTTPYSYSTNFNMQVEVANTGNTSSLAIVTACWAMGACDDNTKVSDTINDYSLANQVRAVICGKSPTGAYENVLTDGAGDLTVAVENMPAVCYIGQTGDAGSQLEITTHVHAAPPTYVDNTMQPPVLDTVGNLRVRAVINAPRGNVGSNGVQSTSASPVTLIAAGATGVYNDITQLILTNEDQLTATVVTISDGTKSYNFAIPVGGGGVFPFVTPLPASSTATAWTVSNNASVNIDCVVTYINGN